VEKVKVISRNRKAYHNYFIDESYEAGIVLTGTEVKSVRQARVNLKDGYAQVDDGELFLCNVHISPYDPGNRFNHDPLRRRKLLMHRREIDRLDGRVREKGYTLVPLRIYLKGGLVKVELALARGKRMYDKRQVLREKESQREAERALKERSYR